MDERLTVLFVEDDPALRAVLGEFLPEDEFRSMVVGSGPEALSILARESIDLLVTDLVMEGIRGVELAWDARRLYPGLRVIFMTGHISQVTEAQEIGPVLFKPIRLWEVEGVIRQYLP